jgi:prevent-host-death family protein
VFVRTISYKELRSNVSKVLRRAEAGEELTITVCGRPVASLAPAKGRSWVPSSQLTELWNAPDDPTLGTDLEGLDCGLRDLWEH